MFSDLFPAMCLRPIGPACPPRSSHCATCPAQCLRNFLRDPHPFLGRWQRGGRVLGGALGSPAGLRLLKKEPCRHMLSSEGSLTQDWSRRVASVAAAARTQHGRVGMTAEELGVSRRQITHRDLKGWRNLVFVAQDRPRTSNTSKGRDEERGWGLRGSDVQGGGLSLPCSSGAGGSQDGLCRGPSAKWHMGRGVPARARSPGLGLSSASWALWM